VSPALNNFYMRLQDYKEKHGGESPPAIYVLPEERDQIKHALFTYDVTLAAGLLFGVPVKVVPFVDDPVFKRLQVMARLVGASIEYPHEAVAEFLKDGAGWRFVATVPGKLYPIEHTWS
jgi:hypothetical protein